MRDILLKKDFRFLVLGLVIGIIGLLLALFYRPFINSNNIDDYHFADTLGSLFCVPVTIFISVGITQQTKFFRLLLSNSAFWFVYKTIDAINGSVNYYDYVAIVIGSFITMMVVLLFHPDTHSKDFFCKRLRK